MDYQDVLFSVDAQPAQLLHHVDRLNCTPVRPTHAANAQLQLTHASQKQIERIVMRRPHFAYLGRRLFGWFELFIGLQSKASEGLLVISVIARVAVILGAQGVAGDGNQFFVGALT